MQNCLLVASDPCRGFPSDQPVPFARQDHRHKIEGIRFSTHRRKADSGLFHNCALSGNGQLRTRKGEDKKDLLAGDT